LANAILAGKWKTVTALVLALGMLVTGAVAYPLLSPKDPDEPKGVQNTPPSQGEPVQARTDLYGDPLPDGALTRLGTLRFRGRGPVFAPDGESFVTSRANLVFHMDLATGKLLRRFAVPLQNDTAFALSPDGKTLAAGVYNLEQNFIQFWDLATGQEL